MKTAEALREAAPLSRQALETLVRAHLSDSELETLAHRSQKLTRQRFGRTMQLYAPLYLSNECVNVCTYCGYSRTNKIARRTLTLAEVRAEAQTLVNQGLGHILLVAGEHPKLVGVDYLTQCVEAIRDIVPAIAIEVAPLDRHEYDQLTAAGASGLIIYQETYDRTAYADLHVSGPKRDFEDRLDRLSFGAQAGMRLLGLGCLWGLAPWQDDFMALIDHARRLQKSAWSAQLSLSFPRLQDATGVDSVPHPLGDRDLVKLILLSRLALPEVHLVMSTRESASFRDAVAPLGITMMSAGSRTSPGAYSLEGDDLEQFSIHDHRSVGEVIQSLRQQGFDAHSHDWHQTLHGALT